MLIFEQYEIGDKVFVKLNKLYMTKIDGVLTVGYPNGTKVSNIETEAIGSFIYNSGENSTIIPTEINISDILNEQYQNTLVKVNNVQLVQNELDKAFAFFTGDDDGSRTLETCGESAKLDCFYKWQCNFCKPTISKRTRIYCWCFSWKYRN